MALGPLERLLNKQARKTITYNGRKIIISGKVGTLQYLGLTPDSAIQDISLIGVDKSYNRKGYKRARWYGDSGGASVGATVVNLMHYPQAEGATTPGKPVEFEAVSDTGGDSKGRKVTGTVEVSGPFGSFVAYMTEHRPTHSIRLKSPRGKWLAAPLLSAAEFAAL